MIKAIIFDCFGVLVGRGFDRTYRMAGGNPVKDRAFIENILGQANLGLISDKEFQAAVAGQIGLRTQEWQRVMQNAEQLNIPLLVYIKELHTSYKTAILSNANAGVVNRLIGQRLLDETFDQVIISAEEGIVKPDIRIYQFTIDRLGVLAHECLYVDDREVLLEPAERVGMQVLLYDDYTHTKEAIKKLLA